MVKGNFAHALFDWSNQKPDWGVLQVFYFVTLLYLGENMFDIHL